MKKSKIGVGWAAVLLTLALLVGATLAIQAQPGSPSHWRAHRPLIVRGMLIGPPRRGAPFVKFKINSSKPSKGKGGGGSSTVVYYGPQSIWSAYYYPFTPTAPPNSEDDGSGQTIAIVDAYSDPSITKDLSAFDSQFGLPAPPSFTIEQPEGEPSNNSGWALEQSLDVEWAHAMAPGANIVLVEAVSPSLSYLLNAVQYAATYPGAEVVSMSWGGSEFPDESSYDSSFSSSSVTFVAASGDSHSVYWPAASPDVIGVGGTTLEMKRTTISETAWSDSGGGISAYESEPGYQLNFVSSGDGTRLGETGNMRGVPDVSYDANPNTGLLVFYNRTWYVVGGTSCGAPQWSAIVALVNQANQKISPLGGGAGSDLYSAATSNYNAYFRDITNSGFGYDFYTGLGSPDVNELISDL
ncbi:MAG: S53 family peptidase [Armatimonadetes bacterium]|nr:S53 family peptidase [Armatimonadota bacterium]